jgi:hypothetical protein
VAFSTAALIAASGSYRIKLRLLVTYLSAKLFLLKHE